MLLVAACEQGLESLRDLGPPSHRALEKGREGSAVPSLAPPPEVADVTCMGSENSSGTGRKMPRVLTRGVGNSVGTLVSGANGNAGFGSQIPK